jgi:tRNA (guanine-N7-)-methyltransferase
VHRALAPGGLFVFQTDNPAYWKYACRAAPELFEWRVHEGPWPDAPDGRTLREMVARSRGLEIFRAVGVKRELDDAEVEARVSLMPEPDFDANKPGYDADTRGGERPQRRFNPRRPGGRRR